MLRRMVTRLLTLRAVIALTSLSRTSVYRLQAAGLFPRAVKISERRVAWLEDEVAEYIESRVAKRAA